MEQIPPIPCNIAPYTPLEFDAVRTTAHMFADKIEESIDELEALLLRYESFEVVEDEIARTLDLLRNLSENEQYFKLRIGEVTAFLPRNQPLYAFSCFVIVPSLMASEVHFRIPHSMHGFFEEMLILLEVEKIFPNVFVSTKQRLDFLTERSALRVDPVSKTSRPVTDVVIFTGTSERAAKLRRVFDQRTLFISNGSGHNPVVVSEDANLDMAVKAVTTLQFYNQGQDCAAPNAILVQRSIYPAFLDRLYKEVQSIKIGEYADRSSKIGPISDVADLVRIQEFLCDNAAWIEPSTPGLIETRVSIVHPTIITKPLSQGGNYSEIFAPIIFLQTYSADQDLSSYFETDGYAENAMYLTVFGTSKYIQGLVDREVNGSIIHPKDTVLHNTHLHAPGVERGVAPYGGYGIGASSISIGGNTIALPTLPQRDIYEYVARPLLEGAGARLHIDLMRYSDIYEKNVSKILRLPNNSADTKQFSMESGPLYMDLDTLEHTKKRYIELQPAVLHQLLPSPNSTLAAGLDVLRKQQIEALVDLIQTRDTLSEEEFKTALYAIPKIEGATSRENKEYQKHFFSVVYQLLFGKDMGPKLTVFLREAEMDTILKLLDIL